MVPLDLLPHDTLAQWLTRVSNPNPVWAVGSTAAITCAQGWALLHMVAGLAARRTPSMTLTQILQRSDEAKIALLQCAADDAQAVRAMLKNPGPDAWLAAIEAPIAVWRWADEGQRLAGHPDLTNYQPAALDLAGCQTLFAAATSISQALVEANTSTLPESQQASIRRGLGRQ